MELEPRLRPCERPHTAEGRSRDWARVRGYCLGHRRGWPTTLIIFSLIKPATRALQSNGLFRSAGIHAAASRTG